MRGGARDRERLLLGARERLLRNSTKNRCAIFRDSNSARRKPRSRDALAKRSLKVPDPGLRLASRPRDRADLCRNNGAELQVRPIPRTLAAF
jgi:hypothetical protein